MPEDKFDRARELVWGTPGFLVSRATIVDPGTSLIHGATYVVETVKNDEGYVVFLQSIGAEGSQRLVLPGRVANTLHSQFVKLAMKARSERAKRGAATRKQKAVQEAQNILSDSR